jgi:GTPase SAR1 family protein
MTEQNETLAPAPTPEPTPTPAPAPTAVAKTPVATFSETLQAKKTTPKITADKILFTGLDNGGKTSIIKILQKQYSQIAILKPTRQAQRRIFEFLGKAISEWDLGGQEKYRIAFLKEPTKYFDNTSVCIYVLDIQDKRRFRESLSYFKDVITTFKKLNITPFIFFWFHKFDPDYEKEQGILLRGYISEMKQEVRSIVQEQFNVTFLQTTIFDLWSIIHSFSQILLKLYPQSDLLDKTIQEFAERIQCEAAIVLDDNSLVIGQYFQDESSKNILANSTPYFLTLSDSLQRDTNVETSMAVERDDKLFYMDHFRIEKAKGPLFVLLLKSLTIEKTFNKDKVDAFIEILKSIL